MNTLGSRLHVGHHWMHYACLLAVVAVVAAVAFAAPVLVISGAKDAATAITSVRGIGRSVSAAERTGASNGRLPSPS